MDSTPVYISVDTMAAGPELDALAAEWVMGWRDGTEVTRLDEWHPSTDIVVAMTLVDKWEGALDMARSQTGNWNVRLLDGEVVAMAYARTLPHAICRAALKAALPVPEVDYSDDDED
jgi:hypothetical protein